MWRSIVPERDAPMKNIAINILWFGFTRRRWFSLALENNILPAHRSYSIRLPHYLDYKLLSIRYTFYVVIKASSYFAFFELHTHTHTQIELVKQNSLLLLVKLGIECFLRNLTTYGARLPTRKTEVAHLPYSMNFFCCLTNKRFG